MHGTLHKATATARILIYLEQISTLIVNIQNMEMPFACDSEIVGEVLLTWRPGSE